MTSIDVQRHKVVPPVPHRGKVRLALCGLFEHAFDSPDVFGLLNVTQTPPGPQSRVSKSSNVCLRYVLGLLLSVTYHSCRTRGFVHLLGALEALTMGGVEPPGRGSVGQDGAAWTDCKAKDRQSRTPRKILSTAIGSCLVDREREYEKENEDF